MVVGLGVDMVGKVCGGFQLGLMRGGEERWWRAIHLLRPSSFHFACAASVGCSSFVRAGNSR
jgi:hypothetical protein